MENSRENVVAGFYRAKKKFAAATAAPTLHSWLVSAASRVSATFKSKKKKRNKVFQKVLSAVSPKATYFRSAYRERVLTPSTSPEFINLNCLRAFPWAW